MTITTRFQVCKLAAQAEARRIAGDPAGEMRAIRAACALPGITWAIWSGELLGVRRIRGRVLARRKG